MIAGISVAIYAVLVIAFGFVNLCKYKGGPFDETDMESGGDFSKTYKNINEDSDEKVSISFWLTCFSYSWSDL